MGRVQSRSRRSIGSVPSLLFLLLGLSFPFGTPSHASMLPATGTIAFHIATLPPLVVTGTGSASSVGAAGSVHTIPAGFFSVGPSPASAFILPTFTGIDHYTIPTGVQNASGSFGPNGAMPLLGSVAYYGKGGTPAGTVPLFPVGATGMTPFGIGPLAGTVLGATFVGAGGPTPVIINFNSVALAIPITVTATAWDNRTAGGVGDIQLVAPATGDLGIFGALPVFGLLRIEYTPEPSTWVLLAGGLCLLGVGRTKALRRQAG